MKKFILASFFLLLGIGLVFFNGEIAFFTGGLFYKNEADLRGAIKLAEDGRLEEAGAEFSLLAMSDSAPGVKAVALYDLGVLFIVRAARGDKSAVKTAFMCFLESLRLTPPGLFEAKFNLEKLIKSGGQKKEEKKEEQDEQEKKKEPSDKSNRPQNYTPFREPGI